MTRPDDVTRTERLGRGLLGTVYRATLESRDGPVALKELDRTLPSDRETFRQYFEALARLDHPHLVDYLTPIENVSPFAFLVEYVEGTDIATYLRRPPTNEERDLLQREHQRGASDSSESSNAREDNSPDQSTSRIDVSSEQAPHHSETEEVDSHDPDGESPESKHDRGTGAVSAEAAANRDRLDLVLLRLETLIPQIVSTLQYLHRFRTPHGGLTPGNILVDSQGRCRLADFGLVEHLQPFERLSPTPDEPLYESLQYARSYRAPELGPSESPTPEADRYALGCILFEAIAGCRPLELEEEGAPGPRESLEASNFSELAPRCPAPWVDLVMRLLSSDPEVRPSLDEVQSIVESSHPRSVDIPPTFVPEQEAFFGRSELLEQIIDDVQAHARRQSLGISLLSGEAGVGKTALAEHIGHWASKRGWLVLRGQCHRRESGIYQGWEEIAAQIRDICERTEGELGEILETLRQRSAQILPGLGGDDSDRREGEAIERPRRRHEAVSKLRELLRRLASQRPLLILMDDLDQASRDTASLLADLIMEPDELPCVIIGTWRSREGVGAREEGPKLLDALRDTPVSVHWCSVRGFSDDEGRRYLETTGPQIPDDMAPRLLQWSRGNPLLLEELIYQHHLIETDEADDIETLPVFDEIDGDDEQERAPIPDIESQLTTLVQSRLDELSRRELFVVELLSVASLPLSKSLVSLVLDEEFHSTGPRGLSVRDLLERLRRLRLLRHVRTHRWQEAYALFHGIGRQLLLEDMPDQRYTHLCGHLADAIQRLRPEADGLRFEYLLRADRSPEAVQQAVQHAHRAETCYAFHRAARLWRWIADQPESSRRLTSLDPRRELARVEQLAGRPDEAARLFDQLAADLPEGLQRTRLRSDEFEARIAAGDRAGAVEALQESLAHYGDRYDANSLVTWFSEWKHRTIAATNRWSDDLERTSTDEIGAERMLQVDLYRRSVWLNDILDSTRGPRFRAKLSALAERSKHALLLGYDRFFLGWQCHPQRLHRRPDRAREWYDEAAYLFERAEAPLPRSTTELARANLHRKAGDFEQSHRALEGADEWADQSPDRSDIDFLIPCERARLYIERGELEEAEAQAHKILHFFRGHALASFRARQILLPMTLLRGAIERAELVLDRCRDFVDSHPPSLTDLWLLRQQTRLALARGRPEVAVGQIEIVRDRLERADLLGLPYVQGMLHMNEGQAAIALAERKRSLGERRRHDLHDRVESSVTTLRTHLESFDPPMRAEMYRLMARHALARGRENEARQAVEDAHQQLASYPNPISRTLCAEAKGLVHRHSSSIDSEGTSLIEQSRILYEHRDLRAPLVLEGWPIPERDSLLQPDDEDGD